jgi:hypothetical protein
MQIEAFSEINIIFDARGDSYIHPEYIESKFEDHSIIQGELYFYIPIEVTVDENQYIIDRNGIQYQKIVGTRPSSIIH